MRGYGTDLSHDIRCYLQMSVNDTPGVNTTTETRGPQGEVDYGSQTDPAVIDTEVAAALNLTEAEMQGIIAACARVIVGVVSAETGERTAGTDEPAHNPLVVTDAVEDAYADLDQTMPVFCPVHSHAVLTACEGLNPTLTEGPGDGSSQKKPSLAELLDGSISTSWINRDRVD